MKKTLILIAAVCAAMIVSCGSKSKNANTENNTDNQNQEMKTSEKTFAKGRVETYDFGTFKLHVYYTNDALGDASYIVEGKDGLVTLEEPLFKDNVAEYNSYLEGLGKPVSERIADYHLGGTEDEPLVMPEGMPEFTKGPVYGGMMAGFAKGFGDAIVGLPTGEATEVEFGSVKTYSGVTFKFLNGASSDFPGASLLIGDKVYFTHWAPAKAHPSPLHIGSVAAIDAQLAETEASLKSGATLFIGGHGGAATKDAAEFKVAYLKKMKELRSANADAESFAAALDSTYPDLAGKENVSALAAALYK